MEIKINEKESLHLLTVLKDWCYDCGEASESRALCDDCDFNKLLLKVRQHNRKLYIESMKTK